MTDTYAAETEGRDPEGIVQQAKAVFQDLADVAADQRAEAIAQIRAELAKYEQ